MGMHKDLLAQRDELSTLALSALVAARTLNECPYHEGSYFDGSGDVEAAYRIANARITAGRITLPSGTTRADLSEAIKRAHNDHAGSRRCYVSSCNPHD